MQSGQTIQREIEQAENLERHTGRSDGASSRGGPGRSAEPGSLQRVADRLGVDKRTISDARQHPVPEGRRTGTVARSVKSLADGGTMEPAWEGRLRELRRVVPIAQTQSIGGVILTLFSLDDYAEGFAVRLRILLEDWHPVAEEERMRNAAFHRQWAEERLQEAGESFALPQEAEFVPGDIKAFPYPELELLAFGDQGQQFPHGYDGGSQWGSDLEGWVESRYSPALDPSVRHIRLEVPDVQWSRVRGKRTSTVEFVDRGPWTFVVPL